MPKHALQFPRSLDQTASASRIAARSATSVEGDHVGETSTAAAIRALAERHNVAYAPTATDAWADHVTRLAGDDVALDDIERLLIALQRAGHLSRSDALGLQAKHLREARP